MVCAAVAACGWNPSRPFDRNAPEVNEAVGQLADGGDAQAAASLLEKYLSTGACSDGSIGTPELLHRRADGTFDLGLSLFKIGESFGHRFGDEELDGGHDEQTHALRGAQVACALRVVQAIAGDESVPLELRARARYLEGNLDFLDGDYKAAVQAYDRALTMIPGELEAGDTIGRDAAWNRAIALRRIEDQKDAGHDASDDNKDGGKDGASGDSGKDSGGDSGSKDSGSDSGGGGKDSGNDSGGQDSGGGDSGEPPPPPQSPDAGPPTPPPGGSQDERILDQLENAPTVQQEAAKKAAAQHRVPRGMVDK